MENNTFRLEGKSNSKACWMITGLDNSKYKEWYEILILFITHDDIRVLVIHFVCLMNPLNFALLSQNVISKWNTDSRQINDSWIYLLLPGKKSHLHIKEQRNICLVWTFVWFKLLHCSMNGPLPIVCQAMSQNPLSSAFSGQEIFPGLIFALAAER